MSRVWVIIKRFGKLLKFMFICIVATVCIFMLWRVFSTGTPKSLKPLLPNEKLNTVYEQKGEDLYIFKQNYDDITRKGATAGYFAVPEAKFIPDANQAQIVFRYNNSTITSMAQDYKLDATPDRSEKLFDVSLVLFIDLTPENKEDNYKKGSDTVKEIRVTPILERSDKTKLYNFYRYVFDFDSAEEEVNLAELIQKGELIAVHTQFYYIGDLDYESDPYGALCIYDYRAKIKDVKLSGKDISALEG